ncbi:MAG: histone deacetylase [Candidatus Thermoplasmatota archaeon]
MRTHLVYSHLFDNHNCKGHPENAERLHAMIKSFKESPLQRHIKIIEPSILPEGLLYKVHSPDMIEQVKEMSDKEDKDESWIDLDTYVCRSDYETARLAAGGLLQLCREIIDGTIDNGYALIRPPGHHATRLRSMGFCLFNNAAIAAHYLTTRNKRVLIIDHDVHHGNGTQDIFYDRNDVMYQSFHLSPHYPGTGDHDEIGEGNGKGYTINAPLPYGSGDKAVTNILEEIMLPVAREFKPDFIIISAGYDSHHLDPLGGLKLTVNMYGEIIKRYSIIQPRVICTLEGGYNLEWIGKCMLSQLGEMTSKPIQIKDSANETADITPLISKIRKQLRDYWSI